MGKRDIRFVGYVSDEIIKKWCLDECTGKQIVRSLDLYSHIEPHKEQFISLDSFYHTIDHINDVIESPDYVFYDMDKGGIEYYKMLMENVCIVVQTSNKRDLYVASVYPVTETKIKNRKNKEQDAIDKLLLEKYRYKGNDY